MTAPFPALISLVFGNAAVIYMNLVACRESHNSALLVAGLTVPLYWIMMSIAALKGTYQLIRNPSYWEKTFHGLGGSNYSNGSGSKAELSPAEAPEPGGRRVRTTRWVFWICTALYLAVGLYLTLGQGFLMGDALSRISAARSVWFSRDPHLAAIGFVFTPLTALAQLPTVLLSDWWPGLTSWGVTGVVMSAPFMAGAVVQIFKIGTDRGCPMWLVWLVAAVFALNPMLVFYGGNGMSEAPFLLMMCWAGRCLIRWCTTDDVHDLMAVGIALGVAYLARYDAVAAGAAATAFVFVVAVLRRGWTNRRTLVRSALLDAVLVTFPVAMSFILWAVISWLITGQAFQQFSSAYGNTNILEQSGGGSTDAVYALLFSIAATTIMGPALPLLFPVSLVLAWQRRDLEVVTAIVMFGSILAFPFYSYVSGSTFPFLRFYFCALPLMAVLALQLVPAGAPLIERRHGPHGSPRTPMSGSRLAPAVLAAVIVIATPAVTGPVMLLSPSLSSQQYALRSVFFTDPTDPTPGRATERRIIASFSTEREIAKYLDAMNWHCQVKQSNTNFGRSALRNLQLVCD